MAAQSFEAAKILYTESLEIRIALHDTWGVAGSHFCLGNVNRELHHYESSAEHYIKCVDLFLQVDDKLGFSEALEGIFFLLAAAGKYRESIMVAAMADSARQRIGVCLYESAQAKRKVCLGEAQSHVTAEQVNEAISSGQSQTERDALLTAVAVLESTLLQKTTTK
eukprot:TRINITY_DN4079_c0_g1_i1.p1 TRINITY_DN4079_c0_g1~~TRINITY_DN4079_c0_g1_i1.p1  ORF type:complete len:166 (-),score=36.71 TRINITY_DN4079_c0_g1_i1:9-506(-)